MGGRSGGLGLRTSAKRISTSKRMSATPRNNDVAAALKDFDSQTIQYTDGVDNEDPAIALPPKEIPGYVPKFKGAAEMEARRNIRMLARRRGPNALPAKAPIVPVKSNLTWSSSDEDESTDEQDKQV